MHPLCKASCPIVVSLLLFVNLAVAGDKEEEDALRISFYAKDEPLDFVIMRLREKTGKKIILGENREGVALEKDDTLRVTIAVLNMYWKYVLVLVAWEAGAVVEESDGTWKVYQRPVKMRLLIDVDRSAKPLAVIAQYIRDLTGKNILLGNDREGKPIEENRDLIVTEEIGKRCVRWGFDEWELALAFICRKLGVHFKKTGPATWLVGWPAPFHISFRDAELHGAFLMLAKLWDATLIVGPDVPADKRITATFQTARLEKALETVAGLTGLAVRKAEGEGAPIYTIVDVASPAVRAGDGPGTGLPAGETPEKLLRRWKFRIDWLRILARRDPLKTYREWRSLLQEMETLKLPQPHVIEQEHLKKTLQEGEIHKQIAGEFDKFLCARTREVRRILEETPETGKSEEIIKTFLDFLAQLFEAKTVPEDAREDAAVLPGLIREILKKVTEVEGNHFAVLEANQRIRALVKGTWKKGEFIVDLLKACGEVEKTARTRLEFGNLNLRVSAVIDTRGDGRSGAIVNGQAMLEGEHLCLETGYVMGHKGTKVVLEKVKSEHVVWFVYKGVRIEVRVP